MSPATKSGLGDLISRRLREIRRHRRLTQAQVASALGISRGAYAQWERGRITNLRSDYSRMLSRVFGVSQDWLTGQSDDAHSTPRPELSTEALAVGELYDALPEACQKKLIDQAEKLVDEQLGGATSTVTRLRHLRRALC